MTRQCMRWAGGAGRAGGAAGGAGTRLARARPRHGRSSGPAGPSTWRLHATSFTLRANHSAIVRPSRVAIRCEVISVDYTFRTIRPVPY